MPVQPRLAPLHRLNGRVVEDLPIPPPAGMAVANGVVMGQGIGIGVVKQPVPAAAALLGPGEALQCFGNGMEVGAGGHVGSSFNEVIRLFYRLHFYPFPQSAGFAIVQRRRSARHC